MIMILIKTQILLWKTTEGNRRLRIRVMVWGAWFLLFHSELAYTDPWCNMLQTLLGQRKYEEAMPDEHPLKVWLLLPFRCFLLSSSLSPSLIIASNINVSNCSIAAILIDFFSNFSIFRFPEFSTIQSYIICIMKYNFQLFYNKSDYIFIYSYVLKLFYEHVYSI